MMRKRGERALTELYDITEQIKEAEITPVLEGNCRIQGPVDESDPVLQRTNLGGFPADKKVTFMSKSYCMRVESGTCNVCSAPCSSCMHESRSMLAMESKIEHGSSSNRRVKNESDSCSFICADGTQLYKSRICDDMQCTDSEASNLLSTSSSHDSYSENAESKAPVRASVTCAASDGIDIPPFVPLEEDQDQSLQENNSVIGDCLLPSNSHITSDLCPSASSKRDEELRILEHHRDDISRVTGSKDSIIEIDHHNISSDTKISTYSSPLFDDLHCSKVKSKVQVEAGDCHDGGNEHTQSDYKRQITCTKEYSQNTCEDSANASTSDKANTTEVHITKYNSSLKCQSPWSPSHNRYAAFHNDHSKDTDCSHGSQLNVDGESSLGTQLTGPAGLDEKKPSSHHENSKAFYTGNGLSTDSVMISDTCVKSKIGLDKGITSDEVMKSTIINKEFEMSSSLMDEVSKMHEELEPQPLQVMESRNSESEPELTDVKVCDICGDAGREYLLTFCSRCSDGAEHTYCMRKMLRKVPEGDWLCEECRLKEEAERKKLDRPDKVSGAANECKLKADAEVKVDGAEKVSVTAKVLKLKDHTEAKKGNMSEAVKEHAQVKKGNVSELVVRTSKECKQEDLVGKKVDASETISGTSKETGLKDTSRKFANKSNLKLMPKLDMKAINPDVRKLYKEVQSPTIIANRRVEIQEVTSPSRKRSSEISIMSTEMGCPRKKIALSRGTSFKNSEMGKTRAVSMPPTNAGKNRNSSGGFSRLQSKFGSHSSKVQAQLQPPCGIFSHSSSFNSIKSNPKPKQVEAASFKSKLDRQFSLNDTRRSTTNRLMTKSASFKSTSPDHNTASASKSQFRVEDPRSPKLAKERNIVDMKNSFILNRHLPNSSPGAGTNISVPILEIKTALHDIKLNYTSESTNLRMKGSDDANDTGRKEASISSSKIVQSISLNPKSNNEEQRLCQTPKDSANESSTSNETLHTNDDANDIGRKEASISSPKIVQSISLNPKSNNEEKRLCQTPKDSANESSTSSETLHNNDDANDIGRKEASISSPKIVQSISMNPKSNNEKQRLCQTPKDSANESSTSSETLYNNAETMQRQGVPQIMELGHQENKTTDSGIFSISRLAVSDGSRISHSQRCNETSHATLLSPSEKLPSFAVRPSVDKNCKDGNKKRTRWRDAVESTILNSRLQKNMRQGGESEDLPIFSADESFEEASKVLHSSYSSHPRKTPLFAGTSNGREISRISYVDTTILTPIKDVNLSVEALPTSRDVQLSETSCTSEKRDLNATASVSGVLNTRHLMSDQASVPANLYRTSAIPHLEFIWQGSFELVTTGNESAPFDGIQAHMSTSASPKVLELANEFPCMVQVEEVPWNITRPLHFKRIGPDEHNIALFFFAKDVESYERSYSKLLEKMLTDDLALRGIINDVELLIFPSTKLPLHSQRWNRLFFLWGMFKGRMVKRFASELNSQKRPFAPDLNVDPVLQDFPCVLGSVVPDSHKAVSVENPQGESYRCDVLSKDKALKSTTCEETWAISSSKVNDGMCNTLGFPIHNSSFQYAAYNRLILEQNSCPIPLSHLISSTNNLSNLPCPRATFQITNSSPCSEVKIDDTYLNKHGNEFGGRHAATASDQVSTYPEQIKAGRASTSCSTSDCRKGGESRIIDEGMGKGEISSKNEAIFYEDQRWKRAGSCLTEALSQAHGRECKNTFSRGDLTNSSSREEPLFPSCLNEHSDCRDDDSGELVNHDDARRQEERFFFPVKPDNPIHILSSDEEDAEESISPNLELALWDNKNKRKDRPWKEPLDGDVSASLSLSLALPSPKRESWPKPNLQERPDINTALLLFGGGFTDT